MTKIKFWVSHWILHVHRNATKPLQPLRGSWFLDPLTEALIVDFSLTVAII